MYSVEEEKMTMKKISGTTTYDNQRIMKRTS